MGKKKKKKSTGQRTTSSNQSTTGRGGRSKYSLFALGIGIVLVITGGYFLYQRDVPKKSSPPRAKLNRENLRLRETRPTLPPEQFKGRVRRAYEIAREIPEVLDRLYCYCRCRENFGHKSLLSCYVDTHASTWDICMDEAQLASRMHAEGATISEISDAIDRKFGK